MKTMLKSRMESVFDDKINEAFENNPYKGTPLEGSHIYQTIAKTAGKFKNGLSKEGARFGLTEEEINLLVDEVSSQTIDKYLEF